MPQYQLIKEATGEVIVPDLEIANSFFSRLKGLMFRKTLGVGKAILLVPCGSVHTHWLKFSLDIIMVDKHGVILDQKNDVSPWKMASAPSNTYAVIEWPSGSFKVDTGERLRVTARSQTKVSNVPKNLGYLFRNGV